MGVSNKAFFTQMNVLMILLSFILPNPHLAEIFLDKDFQEAFQPKLTIDARAKKEGEFFLLEFNNLIPNDVIHLKHNVFSDDKPRRIYYCGQKAYAVIPLDYYSISGEYDLDVSLERHGNTRELLQTKLTVLPREYAMQNLVIKKSIDKATRTDDAYAEYHEKFMPARLKSDNIQYWQGKFIMPLAGEPVLTTDYGAKRTVNGSLTNYRHNGIDLAAPTGTPIMATNRGKVVFAERLQLTGNTIVIDHGLGFFSYYLHCDELLASVGAIVEKGQVIAKVGTTGFSTGAHLHFTTSYHHQNIDPFAVIAWDGNWQK